MFYKDNLYHKHANYICFRKICNKRPRGFLRLTTERTSFVHADRPLPHHSSVTSRAGHIMVREKQARCHAAGHSHLRFNAAAKLAASSALPSRIRLAQLVVSYSARQILYVSSAESLCKIICLPPNQCGP